MVSTPKKQAHIPSTPTNHDTSTSKLCVIQVSFLLRVRFHSPIYPEMNSRYGVNGKLCQVQQRKGLRFRDSGL